MTTVLERIHERGGKQWRRLRPPAFGLPTGLRAEAENAEDGDAEAQYRLGRRYLEGRDVIPSRSQAAYWLRAASEQDHAGAQYLLASMSLDRRLPALSGHAEPADSTILFADDRGEAPDFKQAAYWAARAAQKGSHEAQAALAYILSAGPEEMRDLAKSTAFYRASAAGGCPQGMLGYALALFREGGPNPNFTPIIANLRAAAEAGLPDAIYLLGVAFAQGLGVEVDQSEAVRLFGAAGAKGHRAAQARFGAALLDGEAVKADPVLGESWLRRAAIAGDVAAAARVGDLYSRADGALPPNAVEASRWYRLAAEGGHMGAARVLGQFYLAGRGVGQDKQQAVAWLRRAAEGGDAAAQAMLGNLAFEGRLQAADQHALCEGFAARARAGDTMAAYNYAVCLSEGIGTPRDDAAAARWFRRASGEVHLARFFYGRAMVEGRGMPRDAVGGRQVIEDAAQAGLAEAKAYLATLAAQLLPRGTEPREAVTSGTAGDRETGSTPPPAEAVRTRATGMACTCGSGLPDDRCCALEPEGGTDTDSARLRAGLQMTRDWAGKGELERAEALCRQMLCLAPRNIDALSLYYDLRKARGETAGLDVLLHRIVALDANNVAATQELATHLFESGDMAGAEHHARNALRLAPSHTRSHAVFGMILTETQRSRLGEVHYRRAVELSDRADPILLANLAWNLKGQSRFQEARAIYTQAVEIAPEVFQTWLGWAQLEEADGQFEAARICLDRAAALRPEDADLIMARGRLFARQKRPDEALAELERVKAEANGHPDPNMLLERGRLLDAIGRYEEAFDCFAAGKRVAREVTGKAYMEKQAAESAVQLKQFFVRSRLRLLPPPQERPAQAQPIFILGFPRSGTTLLEQMITSHPGIEAGDEVPFINEMIDEIPRAFASPLPYPSAFAELWMADNRLGLQTLADSYLRKAELYGLTSSGKPWFTDKMPMNEAHLGLIGTVFPNAPLIHLIRHPLDVVLSVYSHHMTHGFFCAYDLVSIAKHYALVMDLVDHYRAEMSLNYRAVRYEALVEDSDAIIRGVLDHVGVAFDERCLSFQKNRRVPQTPSYSQVSQDLYTRSKYRYRHYRRQLEPVVDILAPTIGRLGYAID